METIVLGGGCFWCLDATYNLINGVTQVEEGYSGGDIPNPTDEQIYYENTGHAEVVRITYDPKVITLSDILEIFWTIHDPTTINRQGPDTGEQYRSVIFYDDETQKTVANTSMRKAQEVWDDPIVTEIQPLKTFYAAADYHKNYQTDRPDYCQAIINPKLTKLHKRFAELIKH